MNIDFKETVDLGMQIRINRIKKGYTIKKLSFISNIPYRTLRSIESEKNKKVSLSIIIRLSNILDVSLEDLIVSREAIA